MLFAIAKQKKSSAIRPVAKPRNYYFSRGNSSGKWKLVKRHGSSSCYLDLWSEKIALDADPDRIGSSFWCLAKALFACQSLYSLINIVSANAKTNTHRSWHEVHRHGRSFEGRKQKSFNPLRLSGSTVWSRHHQQQKRKTNLWERNYNKMSGKHMMAYVWLVFINNVHTLSPYRRCNLHNGLAFYICSSERRKD